MIYRLTCQAPKSSCFVLFPLEGLEEKEDLRSLIESRSILPQIIAGWPQMSVTLSLIRFCVTMKFMKEHEEKAVAVSN
jgi:hypothetical protein